MMNLKTTNPWAVSLLVIALNTAIPNLAFAGGTTGDAAGTTTTTDVDPDRDLDPGLGDGVDEENEWGWIGLLGLLGLFGLKRRDNDTRTTTTR